MIWGALGTFAVRWWGSMQYNLITLKMFLTVARTGSISQASEAENIAASAISKRISDLEDQIGTPLFYRQTRGVELTPAGHELARHSSNLFRLVERMILQPELKVQFVLRQIHQQSRNFFLKIWLVLQRITQM